MLGSQLALLIFSSRTVRSGIEFSAAYRTRGAPAVRAPVELTMTHIMMARARGCSLVWALAFVLLGGCTSIASDEGFAFVQRTTQVGLNKEAKWLRTDEDRRSAQQRVTELLAQPLSVDDAVQVALLNNKGLQAAFDDLGVSQAEWAASTRWPNPGFTFSRLKQGDDLEFDRTLSFSLGRLLTWPLVRTAERHRFEQARLQTAQEVVSLAAQVRRAYFNALAAEEGLRYAQQVEVAAEAGAELAQRMVAAGNWSRLQQAREQGFHADAMLNVERAQQTQLATRERLTRLLGLLSAQDSFRLPEHLPDVPSAPSSLPDIEQRAMDQRLDVQAARQDVERMAQNLGLNRAVRFVNVLELGGVNNSFNPGPVQRGYEVRLELPLFDWGEASNAKAQSLYMRAVNRAAQTAIDARSEVREAYAACGSAYEVARHYRDVVLPLRKRIAEEKQLRYNGMLIDVFELLADARSQIESVNAYILAVRDFWLARSDLDMALVGRPVTRSASASSMAGAETQP